MKIKLVAPKVTTLDIYTRHKGPYRVMYHERIPHLDIEKTKWSKMRFIRAEDVDRYCRELIEEDENVSSASVWTDSGGYFVTTYAKPKEKPNGA